MSNRLPRNCRVSESKSDCLIVIDSDDEDEVIFVNEDGGETLARSEAYIRPGFLENLKQNNEPEVRDIFNNVVRISAETNVNPIVIERPLNESPTEELDEEQIELPNYNVQFLNTSLNTVNQPESNSDKSGRTKTSSINVQDDVATITPIAPKPIIKLAPLSKLVNAESSFIPLSETVSKLRISYPQNDPTLKKQVKQRRSTPKKDGQQQSGVVKTQVSYRSPTKSPKTTNQIVTTPETPSLPNTSPAYQSRSNTPNQPRDKSKLSPTKTDMSPLAEKKAILQKFIPGGSANADWSWDETLKKTINFIIELRKSDCDLDIAEEALLQSNIKLTMDYDKLLHKVYKLCPEESVTDKSPVRRTRYSSRRESDKEVITEKPNECNRQDNKENEESKDLQEIQTSPVKAQEFINNEECRQLQDLLGEVKESAKTHLLNFDPHVPFNEFLPSNLLNWDKPKTKSELLDELMYLENAIEKCSVETEKIRKVSHEQQVFKYETDLDIFKKEFDLDWDNSLNSSEDYSSFKYEVDKKEDLDKDDKPDGLIKASPSSIPLKCSMDNPAKDEIEEESVNKIDTNPVKEVKKQAVSPTKRKPKKKQPWNKGLKKKSHSMASRRKNDDIIIVSEQSDEENSSIVNDHNTISSNVDNETNEEDQIDAIEELSDNASEIPLDTLIIKKKAYKSKKQGKTDKKKPTNKKIKKSKATIKSEGKAAKRKSVSNKAKDDDVEEIDEDYKEPVDDSIEEAQVMEVQEKPKDVIVEEEPKKIVTKISKSSKLLVSVEKINSLINSGSCSKDVEVSGPRKAAKSCNLKLKVDDSLEEEPKRQLRRKKYTGEARTTRSFVKKCSEVMDDVDQEVIAFLSSSKGDRAKLDESESSVSETEEESATINEKVSTDKEERIDETAEEVDKIDDVQESEEVADVDDERSLDERKIEIQTVQQKSPKKKKKKNWGYTKRRQRKTKVVKNIIEQLPSEQTDGGEDSQVTDSKEGPSDEVTPSVEKEADQELEDPDLHSTSKGNKTPDRDDNASDEANGTGSIQIISNCFSIDPSLFDNIDDDDNFDEIPMEEMPEIDLVNSSVISAPEGRNSKDSDCTVETVAKAPVEADVKSPEKNTPMTPNLPIKVEKVSSESPTSPVALVTQSQNDCDSVSSLTQSDHLESKESPSKQSPCDSPLDFSIKNLPTTPESNPDNSPQPLNLSSKASLDASQSENEIIDFSIKNKTPVSASVSDSPKIPVKEDIVPINLIKSSSSCNVPIVGPSEIQTAFTPGKQIFTDPKNFSVCIKPTENVEPPVQTPAASVGTGNVEKPVKDNIINEITDILADLTSGTPESLNFNLNTADKRDDLSTAELSRQAVPTTLNQVMTPVLSQQSVSSVSSTGTIVSVMSSQDSLSQISQQSSQQMPYNNNSKLMPTTNQFPLHSSPTIQTQMMGMGNYTNSQNVHHVQNASQDFTNVHQMQMSSVSQAMNLQSYSQVPVSSNVFPCQPPIPPQQANYDQFMITNQQPVAMAGGMPNISQPHFSNIQREQFIPNALQYEQNFPNQSSKMMPNQCQQITVRDPRLSNRGEINMNDPRILRRLSIQSQESNSSDSDKQMVAFNSSTMNQGILNTRDPRLAKILTNSSIMSPDSPFRCNSLQINQLISEVIKSNNFENYLMTQKGNQILNQNLEDDEEDLNLNRSDFDDWEDDDENEEKARQNLLRKSIDKLIVSNLQEEKATSVYHQRMQTVNESFVQTVTEHVKESPTKSHRRKLSSISSEDSIDEVSNFTRNRVLRSPPMVRKSHEDDVFEAQDKDNSAEGKQLLRSNSSKNDEEIDYRKSKKNRTAKSQAAQRKIISSSDDDDNSNQCIDHLSSDEESKITETSPSKGKRKLSLDEYLGRKNETKELKGRESRRSLQEDGKTSRNKGKYYDDEDYVPGKTKQDIAKARKTRKRVIDSDDDIDTSPIRRDSSEYMLESKQHDETQSENDDNFDDEKTEFSDEMSDHLKRVSNIRHRKLEGSSTKMKINCSKREPQIRRTKFLDELPDVDMNKALVPHCERSAKKSIERSHGLSKMEKQLLHRDNSPKSTRVVRKTITTERIVTKRLTNEPNSSNKKMKTCPEKEKKVYVQERITLKVNERSGLDGKGGINFKCDALKEGEILKVVGGKLVRVRKKLTDSDEEIERERSKLHRGLQIKFKKKTESSSTIDSNPYSVLSGDGVKSSVLERKKIESAKDSFHDNMKPRSPEKHQNSPKNQNFPSIRHKRPSGESCAKVDEGNKEFKTHLNMSRSSSIDSMEDVKSSPVSASKQAAFNQVAKLNKSDNEGSPNCRSSPNITPGNKDVKTSRWDIKTDESASLGRKSNSPQVQKENPFIASRRDIKNSDAPPVIATSNSNEVNVDPISSAGKDSTVSNQDVNQLGNTNKQTCANPRKNSRWDVKNEDSVSLNKDVSKSVTVDDTKATSVDDQSVKEADVSGSASAKDDGNSFDENSTDAKPSMEVALKPDMEVARTDEQPGIESDAKKSVSDVAKRPSVDVAKRLSIKAKRRSSSTEMERRSDMKVGRRESMMTVARREFRQESFKRRHEVMTVRSEWTEVCESSQDETNRSILAMMKRGEINIWENQRGEERPSWQGSETRDDYKLDRWGSRSEREMDRREPLFNRRGEGPDQEWNRGPQRDEPHNYDERRRFSDIWNQERQHRENAWEQERRRDNDWEQERRRDIEWNQERRRDSDWDQERRRDSDWDQERRRDSDWDQERLLREKYLNNLYRDNPQYRGSPPYREQFQDVPHRENPHFQDGIPQFSRYPDRNRLHDDRDMYRSSPDNYRARDVQSPYVPSIIDRRADNMHPHLMSARPQIPANSQRQSYPVNRNPCNLY